MSIPSLETTIKTETVTTTETAADGTTQTDTKTVKTVTQTEITKSPGSFSDDRKKQMDYIQAVIARLNSNSFTIKGWTITITSALLALAGAAKDWYYLTIASLPIFIFWFLDAKYLQNERKFRDLYKDCASKTPQFEPYSMDIDKLQETEHLKYKSALRSGTIKWFYVPLLILTVIICGIGIWCKKTTPSVTNINLGDSAQIQLKK